MPVSSSTSDTPLTHSGVVSENNDGIYDRVIKVADDAISAMCRGSTTNQHGAGMLIYVGARICVEIAKTAAAARPNRLTDILVAVPSIIAIEAAMWVIAGQFSWFIIINVVILLVALICYYEEHICKLLNTCCAKIFGRQGSNTTRQIAQEDMDAQDTEVKGNQAIA